MKNIQTYIKLLKANKNLVLTGAPGTGKTFLAKEIAKAMDAEVEFVQFHPSYDYTDFVEGLRPIKKDKILCFERTDGVFKLFCKKALSASMLFSLAYKELVRELKVRDIDSLDTELRKTYVNENDHIVFRNTDGRNANSQKHYVSEKKLRELYLKISENIQHFEDETKITKDKCKELNGGREVDTTAPLILKELFKRSRKGLLRLSKSSKYVFIIDEINRCELSKIFGELFYAIDPGYRGEKGKVKTQYQNLIDNDDVFVDGFFVPENVYILATMNDIDRSVESMDFALRRRFAWKEIKPEDRMEMLSEKLDHDTCVKAIRVMNALNKDISKTRGLGSAYQIGPAYFLKLDKELYNGDFTALWDMHIEILLKEYLRGYSNADAKVEELKNVYFNSLNGKTVDVAD